MDIEKKKIVTVNIALVNTCTIFLVLAFLINVLISLFYFSQVFNMIFPYKYAENVTDIHSIVRHSTKVLNSDSYEFVESTQGTYWDKNVTRVVPYDVYKVNSNGEDFFMYTDITDKDEFDKTFTDKTAYLRAYSTNEREMEVAYTTECNDLDNYLIFEKAEINTINIILILLGIYISYVFYEVFFTMTYYKRKLYKLQKQKYKELSLS